MLTRRSLGIVAALLLVGLVHGSPKVYAQEGAGGASTRADDLLKSLTDQARARLQQAGAEPTRESWRLLEGLISKGVNRLRQDAGPGEPPPRLIAEARQNLNDFVDWMIDAAEPSPNGKLVGEGSFARALGRCQRPKYPYCP